MSSPIPRNNGSRAGDYDEEIGPDLSHMKSSGGLTISPEMFEKLYLTPKTRVPGDFRRRFANPTPLGFMGFVISAVTFAAILMGWGGATTLTGVAGIFFFTGPVLLLLTTIFEWIMGNFFSMMVMGMFAVFWLSFGVIEAPSWGIAASYSPTGNPEQGALSVGYNAAIALYLVVWGFWLLTMFVFTLRTNIVFVAIFLCATASSFVISASFWKVSTGHFEVALRLQKAGGALFFVLAIFGWYMTFVIMCLEMKLPVRLPVGDLSHFWPSTENSEKDGEKDE